MDPNCLTTKDVARLCKVSDATVKRWEEAGLIRSERTSGGHRRFRAEEVARFQKEIRLGLKQAPGDESVVTAATRRRVSKDLSDCELFHSLIAGQEEEAANFLISEFLAGSSLTEIFDTFVSDTMRTIGELWYEGKLSVAQEHLATRAALCAVHKLRGIVPVEERCGKLAFCLAVEGDFHELSTHLVQMTFESCGWEVMNFGSNTPLYSIIDEAVHHSPEMICVSSTVMNDVERISHDFKSFRQRLRAQNIPVVLGGRAFEDKVMQARFSAEYYPKTFSELAVVARENAC